MILDQVRIPTHGPLSAEGLLALVLGSRPGSPWCVVWYSCALLRPEACPPAPSDHGPCGSGEQAFFSLFPGPWAKGPNQPPLLRGRVPSWKLRPGLEAFRSHWTAMVEESREAGQQDHQRWNWQGKEHDKLFFCPPGSGSRHPAVLLCSFWGQSRGASVKGPSEDLAIPLLCWQRPGLSSLGLDFLI